MQKLKNQHCIVQVLNGNDNICLARCFVLAAARVEQGPDSEEYEKLLRGYVAQREAAKALLDKIGFPDREMSLSDLPAVVKVIVESPL